jgi:LPXTG-motif cell wall-anchored protein
MTFENCTQAYAAGYANMEIGSAGYSPKLDHDHDGVACETPPPGFQPAAEAGTGPETTTESPTTAGPQGGTQTHAGTQVKDGSRLPTTGPSAELSAAGAGMLALGVAGVVLFRRRRTRFSA